MNEIEGKNHLPKRKQNRLPHYDYSTPGSYFITICTENRKCILSNIIAGADALGGPIVNLTSIGKVVEKYLLSTVKIPNVHLDNYVIMPNHIHFILTVESGDGTPGAASPTHAVVPNTVGALKCLVDRELHQTIFQRSYYEYVIRNEADYQQIWEYIDNNPARWAEDRYHIE